MHSIAYTVQTLHSIYYYYVVHTEFRYYRCIFFYKCSLLHRSNGPISSLGWKYPALKVYFTHVCRDNQAMINHQCITLCPTSEHSIVFPPNLACLNHLPTAHCPPQLVVGNVLTSVYCLVSTISPVLIHSHL